MDTGQDGKILALVVRPLQPARAVWITPKLSEYQRIVDGLIEFRELPDYDYKTGGAVVIVNEEYLLNGSIPNRKINDDLIICGTFIVVRDVIEPDGMTTTTGLTPLQANQWRARLNGEALIPKDMENKDISAMRRRFEFDAYGLGIVKTPIKGGGDCISYIEGLTPPQMPVDATAERLAPLYETARAFQAEYSDAVARWIYDDIDSGDE